MNPDTIKRVFAYVRVSTEQQLSGGGLDRQEDACKKFAESKGWSVCRVWKEQESGSVESGHRPILAQLIASCGGAMEIDSIVVERADRIARKLIVSELFFDKCREHGIKVYSADSGEELVDAAAGDPTRVLIRQVLGALAEWNKAEICKKLLAGRYRKKLKTGRPCGGTAPFGSRPEEWPTVRVIMDLYKANHTPRQIADWLQTDMEGRAYLRPGEGAKFKKFGRSVKPTRVPVYQTTIKRLIEYWRQEPPFLTELKAG